VGLLASASGAGAAKAPAAKRATMVKILVYCMVCIVFVGMIVLMEDQRKYLLESCLSGFDNGG